jgi:hypothetical protein
MEQIIEFFVAIFQLIAGLGVASVVSDLTADFNNYHNKIKEDPYPKHLNDYFEDLAEDLVNLTIDEVEGTIEDILLDELQGD